MKKVLFLLIAVACLAGNVSAKDIKVDSAVMAAPMPTIAPYLTLFNDGEKCMIIGSGDPNTLGVTLPGTCTQAVYFNLQAVRGTFTCWIWTGSAWQERA